MSHPVIVRRKKNISEYDLWYSISTIYLILESDAACIYNHRASSSAEKNRERCPFSIRVGVFLWLFVRSNVRF